MATFEVYGIQVMGESKAAWIAHSLVLKSQWFQVTPLPDDAWQFDVKIENRKMLERLAEQAAEM